MLIRITSKVPLSAGFISWKRLAEEMFRASGKLAPDEEIAHFEVSERGINYFVTKEEQPK